MIAVAMRPRRLRRLLTLAGVGAVLGGVTLSQCAPAHATPMSYLQSLNDHGITVTDTTDALTMGYVVCAALDQANGRDVAAALYRNTDIATPAMAATVVVIAVEQLCPQHDHRGYVA